MFSWVKAIGDGSTDETPPGIWNATMNTTIYLPTNGGHALVLCSMQLNREKILAHIRLLIVASDFILNAGFLHLSRATVVDIASFDCFQGW
jgi:hypothetical protein